MENSVAGPLVSRHTHSLSTYYVPRMPLPISLAPLLCKYLVPSRLASSLSPLPSCLFPDAKHLPLMFPPPGLLSFLPSANQIPFQSAKAHSCAISFREPPRIVSACCSQDPHPGASPGLGPGLLLTLCPRVAKQRLAGVFWAAQGQGWGQSIYHKERTEAPGQGPGHPVQRSPFCPEGP